MRHSRQRIATHTNLCEGIFDGENGVRVMYGGTAASTFVETKNAAGEWERLSGVKSITITMSTDKPIPVVKIERIIMPSRGNDDEV